MAQWGALLCGVWGWVQGHVHQLQEWAGLSDTRCACAPLRGGGLYGGPGSGGARWHGLWKLWQLSSTSVKTAGMLSGKSYGGGGGGTASTVAMGGLGGFPGRLLGASCSPFVPWKEFMSREMSLLSLQVWRWRDAGKMVPRLFFFLGGGLFLRSTPCSFRLPEQSYFSPWIVVKSLFL